MARGKCVSVQAAMAAVCVVMMSQPIRAEEPDPAAIERGRKALTLTSHVPAAWSEEALRNSAKLWNDREPAPDPDREPEAFMAAFRKRYGLHPAPYPNDGLPMGLRKAKSARGQKTGLQIDCMVCHGGSIGGQSYVGLGNTLIDLHSLLADLSQADGIIPFAWGFRLNHTRGLTNAGQVSAILLSFRNTDLSRRVLPLPLGARLTEMDAPAWWILGKKATMYYDGRTDSRSARSIMQFFLGHFDLEDFQEMEPTFQDVLAYLKSIKPPKYPFPIDEARAKRGEQLFKQTCARCHGTYGPDGSYPNVVVELKLIGTDPARAHGISEKLVAHYNATWFAEDYPVDEVMTGYQAPPLDGIWATAPYLHNGSVPTLAALLNSPTRPARYWRPRSTGFDQYDTVNVGWKVDPACEPPPADMPAHEARFYFDTSRRGLNNTGHTFGDKLTDEERTAVIEFLKTL